jgi:hypothetical protein
MMDFIRRVLLYTLLPLWCLVYLLLHSPGEFLMIVAVIACPVLFGVFIGMMM